MNSVLTSEGITDRVGFLSTLTDLPVIMDKKTKKKYYNCPCAFDTEVTSFYDNDEKRAVMYAWVLGVNGVVTVGRTWEEFEDLYSLMLDILDTENVMLIIYVHNLSYDFQFMRKHFEWDNVFSLEKRKPVYARTVDNVEFRCSYRLTNKSLAEAAKDLTTYKIGKKVGDLDYNVIRHTKTPLTEKEWGYIEYDARVVMCIIEEKIESDGGIHKIPLTQTGYVRNYCRQACFGKTKSQYYAYRRLMEYLTLDAEEYQQLKRAFMGGFTHANAYYVGKVLSNVKSYDFTSSYPYVMLAFQFPMSPAEKYQPTDKEDFENCIQNYCCLFDLELTNVVAEDMPDHPISSSRCTLIEGDKDYPLLVDNGRVAMAHKILITVTEQDFMVYRHFYEWENARVMNFRRYKKGYLPKAFIESIIKLYNDKTELKDVEGKEVLYAIAKAMLNSCYGMTVTDIVRAIINYEAEEFIETKPDIEEAIEKYNNSKRRFLFYPWGVWVTAYARYNLFTGIEAFGSDYVYSDTDSLKVLNYEKHQDYIDSYNESVVSRLTATAEFFGWSPDVFAPANKKGVKKQLGVWNDEGIYEKFKTLGAKRYLTYRNNKYELTVAGLGKTAGRDYICSQSTDPFDFFSEGMYVPPSGTGKQLLSYGDEEIVGNITDYVGQQTEYHELSWIHMEGAEYTLSISAEFENYLKGMFEHEF